MTYEIHNMLITAIKNILTPKRNALRKIISIELQLELNGSNFIDLIIQYREKIEHEIVIFCQEIIKLCDNLLNTAQGLTESYVLLHKIKADHFRYLSETVHEKCQEYAELGLNEYEIGFLMSKELPNINITRLGIGLNYAIFFSEILNCREKACEIAKSAFTEGMLDSNILDDEQYKESSLIMQLLRDNIVLWSSEIKN